MDALALIDRITPDAPVSWFGALGEFLRRVEKAAPGLVADPRYRRLQEISVKYGL